MASQPLQGRSSECARLDQLLADARQGPCGVLVLRGEAGVGKTALLRYISEQATRFRSTRVAGVESELELAYAGLHQLCIPLLGQLDALPEPQQEALRVALGLVGGAAPDRFLVSIATLGLIAAAAEERPLLCVVDDFQWLDGASARVVAFVARRLLAEPVALVLAVRDPSTVVLDDLPTLALRGLPDADARALLDATSLVRIDARVRDRIIAESHGNPLALLELPRRMTAAELAGGFGAGAPHLGGLEDGFLRRMAALPSDTQRLLRLAAADPVGEPLLLWRAAASLGIDPLAAVPAVDEALLEIGAQVRFSHPLARSAAYRSASPAERQTLHAVLAEATDPELDPDRRAWHHAQAAAGPDEAIAEELERAAARAQARGGIAASAAFLENAATLTPAPAERVQRLIAAAAAKRDAGALDAALDLLAAAQAGSLSEEQTAEVEHLHGRIAFDQLRAGDAARLLLGAARRTGAPATHLEALGAAIWAGEHFTEAALAAPTAPEAPDAVDRVLGALATLLTKGYTAGAPALRPALDAVRALEAPGGDGDLGRWLWLTGLRATGLIALELWDVDAWQELAARQVRVAREAGALVQLQFALQFFARCRLACGELTEAAALIEEERVIAEAMGRSPVGYNELVLAAMRGHEPLASRLIEQMIQRAGASGLGRMVDVATLAKAVLGNGLGHYDAARDAARAAFAHRDHVGFGLFVVAELAEAASRTRDHALVEEAHAWLTVRTPVTHSDWLVGLAARVRGLLADDEDAYRESLASLARTPLRLELARSHLLYGEWLRRDRRRLDAREQLNLAHQHFVAIGADGFAERARHELIATGATARKRRDDTRDDLTPHEERIARLAMAGRTNPEIGAELFISPRTVEWHLKNVFLKLGISSRRGLRDALPEHAVAAA